MQSKAQGSPLQVLDRKCVFCQKIAVGDYDEIDRLGVVRFAPLNPVIEGHMLFVPVSHLQDAATDPLATGLAFEAASRYAITQGVHFNLITSAGSNATQTVLHLHVHYVPREFANDGLKLPWTDQVVDR